MPTCKHFDVDVLRRLEHQPGLEAKVATHHLKLYHLAAAMTRPTLLEFGVDRGRSTCVLLAACEETGGHLYSVDIRDCSDVAQSDAWTFIESSDQDVEGILKQAPALASGVDLLHIDSLHAPNHVHNTLLKWFAYVQPGGYITFHDVDPTPYFVGQRRDNPKHEPAAIAVQQVIRDFFYANEDQLYLEYHFGSTGMGIMRKLSPLGSAPRPAVPVRTRQIVFSWRGLFWTTRYRAAALVRRLLTR